ncbi:MAG: hypothetical protein E7525_00800 [Ruminococcaceae bacterium]|nr:hypothetical protein [Oscillospiraceae bacterium]
MKHWLTTLIYFIGNIVFIALRTIQILLFTESETAFLKPDTMPVNIVFGVLGALLIGALFATSLFKPRKLREVEENSYPCLIISCLVGGLYLISGLISFMTNTSGIFTALVSVLAAATSVLYGFTEFKGYEFPRFGALFLVIVWAWEFILSYFYYTTRPLRLRTVLETFAIVFCILFFLSFAKLKSGVDQSRSAKLLYMSGLVASTLCFASLVPEFIVWAVGKSANLTASCVSPAALLAGGIFAAFISLYCFKAADSNSIPDTADVSDDETEIFKVVNINVDEK